MRKILIATSVIMALTAALPALAADGPGAGMMGARSTSAVSATTIACVGTAVSARETALDAAIATHESAVQAAYTARASALSAAYQQTTATAVRAAVKAAWSAFSTAMKNAASAWRTSRGTAWTTFRAAAKSCKAPSTISDSSMSGSEASGQ